MKLLITGATGFIGSTIARTALAAGHTVTGLARSAAGVANLQAAGVIPARGSLTDRGALINAAQAADAVIHAAGAGQGDAAQAADQTARTALLDALVGSERPLLFTSGSWVFGDTGDTAADEERPPAPLPPFAWRADAEQELLRRAVDVHVVILRPAFVYGATRGGIIPELLDAARRIGTAPYIADGANRWSTVHVNDLAELYLLALGARSGTVLNAAAGPAVTTRQVAQAVARNLGGGVGTQSWELPRALREMGPLAPILAVTSHITAQRAHSELGWRPHHPTLLDHLTA